jgi:dienelactone hydrolase
MNRQGAGLRFLHFLVALGCAVCAMHVEYAKAQGQRVEFTTPGSLSLSREGRFVDAPAEKVRGELYLPEGAGPFPAMVIAHGCGGVSGAERYWASALRAAGYAALIVDSFGPRGIDRTCENLTRLNAVRRVPDQYGALKMLAADPRIDQRRIFLMGMSHGGFTAVIASNAWAKTRFGGALGFRAFFPFYPLCSAHSPERFTLSAPMRIHIGGGDDWTPAAHCTALVSDLKAKGLDAHVTIYEGALHSFDNPSVGPRRLLPNAQSYASCATLRGPSILGPYDMKMLRRCTTTGVHVGYDRAVAERSRQNLLIELKQFD